MSSPIELELRRYSKIYTVTINVACSTAGQVHDPESYKGVVICNNYVNNHDSVRSEGSEHE